jgi:NADH-quinone oxidoreductase subunit L
MFHFMTHAFFKALLFLAAGVVIQALGHERDMTKMGGLRKELPLAFWAFIAGAASLSALPLVTAGYYSKDLIIMSSLTSPSGGWWLWAGGLGGALLTSLYSFRMIFMVFFGQRRGEVKRKPGPAIVVTLVELIVLSLLGGLINIPAIFDRSGGLFKAVSHGGMNALSETSMAVLASSVSIAGVALAYLFFLRYTAFTRRLMEFRGLNALRRLWQAGWGFEWLYDRLLVRPFVWIASVNRDDFMDLFFGGAAWYSETVNRVLSKTQSGKMRWYAAGLAFGAVFVVGLVILL